MENKKDDTDQEVIDILEIIDLLYNKCREYRIQGKNSKAWIYFESVMKLMDSNHLNLDTVDFELQVILYKLLEEFTIFSYYINKKEEGLIVSDRLIFDRESKSLINVGMMCTNQKYYMEKLGVISKKEIKITCKDNFVGMNPSIIKKENGYLMNFRTSNFGLKPGGVYYCRTSDGIIDTTNYILELDQNLNVLSQKEVIDISSTNVYNIKHIKGLEDLIIFYHHNELWGTCTLVNTDPNGIPQIGLCKLDLINNNYVIKTKRPFELINSGRPEKNWLPFSDEGDIKLLYGYDPTEIRIPSENIENIINNGNFLESKVILKQDTEFNFSRFRGSAGPIQFSLESEDVLGWLVIVHEVSWNPDNSRVYTHRFVYLNNNFKITKLSLPWYFESYGIEFCRSICESINGKEIIITCGLKDEEAWCYTIKKDVILNMMKNVNFWKVFN